MIRKQCQFQDLQLRSRLAGLELPLLLVFVEFGATASLPLDLCQHNSVIIGRGLGVDPALPKMLVLLATVANALNRSLARLWIYLACTRTAGN